MHLSEVGNIKISLKSLNGHHMSRRKKRSKPSIPVIHVEIPHDELLETITAINLNSYPGVLTMIEEIKNRKVKNMISLGIGDPCKSQGSRLQVAVAKKIMDDCSLLSSYFYDPMICGNCPHILDQLGFTVLDENTEGSYSFEKDSVFFMPHCPRTLYHNLLAANWKPDLLTNMFIIGNSFSAYNEKCKMYLQSNPTSVETIFDHGVIQETPLEFPNCECMEMTSMMLINREKLVKMDDNFWIPPEKLSIDMNNS